MTEDRYKEPRISSEAVIFDRVEPQFQVCVQPDTSIGKEVWIEYRDQVNQDLPEQKKKKNLKLSLIHI